MEIRFGVQSAQHRSLPASAQRMVNCYLEAAPPAAKSAVDVVPSYGIETFCTVGTGPLRGGTVVNGMPYVVSGDRLFRIGQAGTTFDLGYIPSSAGLPGGADADLIGDGQNVVVISASAGYYYDGSITQSIPDGDFPGADWIAYLDGYAVVGKPGSGQVYVSGVLTPEDWNALDFATAEGAPDDTLYGLVDHRELFLFGRESTEVWYNSGNADFPLERVPSGFIEHGIMSKRAAGKQDNTVYMLSNEGIAYRLDGYQPVRVSNHAFEQAIEEMADKTCRVMAWYEGGHKFVAFKFKTCCWLFDPSTQLWHERVSTGYDTWRGAFVMQAFNRVLVADAHSNVIGALTPDTFTEFGSVLRTECTSAAVYDEARIIEHNRLELCFESGVGIRTGQGSDPVVMLQFSDDGGRKWSNERWRKLGKVGKTKARAVWTRNGSSRDRVYRYAISDPVRRTLTNAILNGPV